jgi:hypothetical protein
MKRPPAGSRERARDALPPGGGWSPSVRRRLNQLIRDGSGRGLAVAFDFDNTLVCGDVGEATLAVLVRERQLRPARMPEALSPAFRTPAGRRIAPSSPPDPTAYYEALLAPTVHGPKDPTPLATGYVWAVEVMNTLRAQDVIRATAEAYGTGQIGSVKAIEVTPGRTAYPSPFFYPEMVDLIAALLRHGFAPWIVSASNVWSVRWMVQEALNPLLRERGARRGIPPEQIVGVSVLLRDGRGALHKDVCLVRQDPGYARLDAATLKRFRLTRWLQFPVPTYSGKVGFLWDVLGGPPELAVGDSPGDHAMLTFARHRLWMARLDKPDYQASTAGLKRRTDPERWMVQPVLGRHEPGLIPDVRALPRMPASLRARVGRSLRFLSRSVGRIPLPRIRTPQAGGGAP